MDKQRKEELKQQGYVVFDDSIEAMLEDYKEVFDYLDEQAKKKGIMPKEETTRKPKSTN